MPKVSVILPVYNGEKFVAETIGSVLAQTHGELELIVVNDGSTDGTSAIIEAFAAEDGRIKVIHQENTGPGGVGGARNSGLEVASGDYVAFVDHDDLYLDTRLARCVDIAERHPRISVFFHDLEWITEDGERTGNHHPGRNLLDQARDHIISRAADAAILDRAFYLFMCLNYVAPHITTIFLRRAPFDEGRERFRTDVANCDADMWVRLAENNEVLYFPEVQSLYRDNSQGQSKNVLRHSREVLAHYERFYSR